MLADISVRGFAFSERDHEIIAQAQPPDAGQRRDEFVDQRAEAEQPARNELAILDLDRFEIGEIEDVEEVGVDEIVGRRLRHAQTRAVQRTSGPAPTIANNRR